MYTTYVWITNKSGIPIDFYLEPYGSSSVIPPRESFYTWSQAPEEDFMSVEFGDESVTLFVPNKAVTKVFHGETLIIDENVPLPDMVKRMSIQAFFNMVGMPRQEDLKDEND